GLFQDIGGAGALYHDDTVFVGRDNVSGIDANTGAGHGADRAREPKVVDRGGGGYASAEHGKLELADLRRVAHRCVDDCAGEAAVFHGGRHQAADSSVV